MNEATLRWIACAVTACLFCGSTGKMLGAMQQAGYKNGVFVRWLRRKENMTFNRLSVLALCLALSTAIVSLCFSYLGTRAALAASAVPMLLLLSLFWYADAKYALKVPTKRTGRLCRLFAVYWLLTATVGGVLLALLRFLAVWNGSSLYALVAYVPYAVMPILLPVLLLAANAVSGVFENARNERFVKRAGQVLDESKITRIAVVGSYGKTSVKNILRCLLSERYSVIATPASYNTPIGVAKTVFSSEFAEKQILIAETGARKSGDIAALCALVKPDYVAFTGVCAQHLETFGSVEAVWKEKSAAIRAAKRVAVCGADLKPYLERDFAEDARVRLVSAEDISEVSFGATSTAFTLHVGEEKIRAEIPLLGEAATENVLLAVTLAQELGLTAAEIADGLKKLQPIPHRLQCIESGGAFILDDGYNANPRGAKAALVALGRFAGRKCVVTPGIIECGVLERELNATLGADIAALAPERVILVGDTLVGAVKDGYAAAGGDMERLTVAATLKAAQAELQNWIGAGDAVLFLNDLPDVY